MPTINPAKRANPIDPGATSGDRVRRNWQRLANGGATILIQLDPNGALSVGPNGLRVDVDPDGAISIGAAGLKVNVDGTTIVIIGDQLVASPSGLTHQQVMGRISIGI